MTVSEAITRLRGKMTQDEFGEVIGVTGNTISRYENGTSAKFWVYWRMFRYASRQGRRDLAEILLDAAAEAVDLPPEEFQGVLDYTPKRNESIIPCRSVDPQLIEALCEMIARPKNRDEKRIVQFLYELAGDRGYKVKQAAR
jgi:transcriptional regulator with XRE-family HTH domain